MFQFRLKTFFILSTLLSVIVGIVILRYQYHWKAQAHYASFEKLYRGTSFFKAEVKAKILTLPDVEAAIEKMAETAPENYLVGGYDSFSSLGHAIDGHDDFRMGFSYQWPNEDRAYDDEHQVDISLSSQLNMEAFDKHVVVLKYVDSKHNRVIAKWMEQELVKDHDVIVEHQTIE